MDKKTKILYIGNKLSAHGLSKTGIETLGPQLETEGFNMIYAGTYKNKFFRLTEMIYITIKNKPRLKYVLIDTYSSSAFWYAWMSGILCGLFNIKYIHILHGGSLPKRLNTSKWFCNQIFLNSYKNVAVSGYLKDAFDKVGYPAIVIPNNIDIEQYSFLPRTNLQPNLLWVRSFHKIYNPNMAADVLAVLLEKYPNAKLCMVGPNRDGSMDEFQSYCKQLGVSKHVKITGLLSKPEWHKLSTNYDIFINTTNVDNTPVSVIEAMALGLPVVSTKVGGIPYLLEDGKNALLVNKGDTGGMIKAIELLLNNKTMSAMLSENARDKAEGFDWEVVKLSWNEILL